jgi:hypothetical protein
MSPTALAAVDWAAVTQAAVTVILTAVSGYFGYLAGRPKAQAEAKVIEAGAKVEETKAQQEMSTKQRAEERKHRKDMIEERDEMIDALKLAREADREELHDLRGEVNRVNLRLAQIEIKLEYCEQERSEREWQVGRLVEELEKRGVAVNLHRLAPPPPGGAPPEGAGS